MPGPDEIYSFWFLEHGPDDWFGGKPDFDAEIKARFSQTHDAVSRGEGFTWRNSARSRLAEVIVLDQFSRQLYRGDGRAFAQDGMALVLAQEAVMRSLDRQLPENERTFLYMPYMHSESLLIHDEAVALFAALPDKEILQYEVGHRACIDRFGRFPFRNAALGRQSTPEELAYMAERTDFGF